MVSILSSGRYLFIHNHIKGTKPPILANFLSTYFYDLKVTFEYIGESPENFMLFSLR